MSLLEKAMKEPTDVTRADLAPQVPAHKHPSPTLLVRPKISDVLDAEEAIIERQVAHYMDKVQTGELTVQEIGALAKLVEATAKLSREGRELRRESKPRNEQELRKFLKEMVEEGILEVDET